MSDVGAVVAVVLAGVVVEALRIVRPGEVLLAPDPCGRYRPGAAPRLLGGRTFAVHLAPLPVAGPTLRVSEAPPPSPERDGSTAVAPAARAGPEADRAAAARAAARDRAVVARADLARAREEIERVLGAARPVSAASRVLALHLILLVPLVLLIGPLPQRWLVLGASLAAIEGVLLTCFARAHRRLHPGRTGRLVQHAIVMALFPPAGVFAADTLANGTLTHVHPLAAVLVVCRENVARRLAARWFRRWRYPLPGEDAAQALTLRCAFERALARAGWCINEFFAPPAPDGPTSVGYCPRCGVQYVTAAGDCADCPGIRKRPLLTGPSPVRLVPGGWSDVGPLPPVVVGFYRAWRGSSCGDYACDYPDMNRLFFESDVFYVDGSQARNLSVYDGRPLPHPDYVLEPLVGRETRYARDLDYLRRLHRQELRSAVAAVPRGDLNPGLLATIAAYLGTAVPDPGGAHRLRCVRDDATDRVP